MLTVLRVSQAKGQSLALARALLRTPQLVSLTEASMSRVFARIVLGLVMLAGCGGDDSNGSASSGKGADSYTCCINGANYSCPNEAAFDKCAPPALDPSGCTHTGDNPDGTCQ
jgi:hypothetical protein